MSIFIKIVANPDFVKITNKISILVEFIEKSWFNSKFEKISIFLKKFRKS